jgi:glycosyltransferase involved in cell wall biosynthesis
MPDDRMSDDRPGTPGIDPLTEQSDRAWLEAQVRELEATSDALLATNRGLNQLVHFLRREIDRLGRIVRVGGVVRGAVRSPGRLRLLRADLRQAVQPRPAPEPPEGSRRPDPALLAAADRGVRLQAIDQRRRDARTTRQVADLRVGLIADPPLHDLLVGACTVIPLHPGDDAATIAAAALDVVLVESAWAGRDGCWRYRIAWHPHARSVAQADLAGLLEGARVAGVPTAFWVTADRHDVGRFSDAARRFDHLFATDDAALDRLAQDRERRWVSAELLPPGVRLDLHHPAGTPDEPGPVFIGSVPLSLPLERREAIGRLLSLAAPRGLVVGDRQAAGDPARFGTPGQAAMQTIARPSTSRVMDLYRHHPVVLLPSHVAASTSAVPARLFEALASGVPVITTRADAVARFVGDLAVASDDPAELSAALGAALDGDAARHRVRAAAATIARTHDVRRRLASIARAAGIAVADPMASVDVVAIVDDPAQVPSLVESLAGDAGAVSSLVIGTAAWDAVRAPLAEALAAVLPGRPVRLVEQSAEASLDQRHRRLAAVADGERVAIVEAGARGGASQAAGGIGGLVGCAEASGAAIVALPLAGTGDAHRPVASLRPFPALVTRNLVEEHGWPAPGPAALEAWAATGISIHAAEPAVGHADGVPA